MLNRFGKHVHIALKCFIVIMKLLNGCTRKYHVISKLRFNLSAVITGGGRLPEVRQQGVYFSGNLHVW